MDDIFKAMFDRELSERERSEKQEKKSREFRASGDFYPSDSDYDPQVRLKRRLRALFPHLPTLPGLPPKTKQD